jgi:hypothetical protein
VDEALMVQGPKVAAVGPVDRPGPEGTRAETAGTQERVGTPANQPWAATVERAAKPMGAPFSRKRLPLNPRFHSEHRVRTGWLVDWLAPVATPSVRQVDLPANSADRERTAPFLPASARPDKVQAPVPIRQMAPQAPMARQAPPPIRSTTGRHRLDPPTAHLVGGRYTLVARHRPIAAQETTRSCGREGPRTGDPNG